MDIANQLATYLATAGFGALGTSIFVGEIPDGIDGLWVERVGGQQSNYVPIEEAALSVYVKDSSASQAIAQLTSIKNFIHRMHDAQSGNAFIYTFLVLGNIEDVQRDAEYAKIYKLTIQAVFRDTGVIS